MSNKIPTRMSIVRVYAVAEGGKSCGKSGYPSTWFVWQIHQGGRALERKDGRPRQWQSREAADKARQKLRG